MKKVVFILLVFFLLVQLIVIPKAYGVTEVIDFSNPNDLNKFIIHRHGAASNGATIEVKSNGLEFVSNSSDNFYSVDLPAKGASKIEFNLKNSHMGDMYDDYREVALATNHFKITFTDGTSAIFYYNHIHNGRWDEYMPLSGADNDFVVKSPDGAIASIGKAVREWRFPWYISYKIDYVNGILSMTSDEGHSYSKYIGEKKIDYITFHPLSMWWSKGAWATLYSVKITTERINKITLTGSSTVKRGELTMLQANIEPNNATDKTLIWSSSDTNVASVDGVGTSAMVRGIKKGTAVITAAAQDGSGVTASKTITVTSDSVQGEAKYILVDDIIRYEAGYADAENDPKYTDEYKYIHNPYSLNSVPLDNSMGYVDFRDKWQDIAYTQFPKVGTYTIQYKAQDNPLTAAANSSFTSYRYYSEVAESTIYVHRKPIALYSINGSSISDTSYDLDHSVSHSTKGIAKWEWQYVNSNGITEKYIASSKADGVNKVNSWLGNYSGVQYKLALRVQDIEGAWSEPCIKAAGEISRPVADFVIDKNPMLYRTDTQKITDMSYDTNGLSLSYQWTVTKGGQTILNSTSKDISALLNTAINGLYPNVTGICNVSLKVTNSAGIQSDIVTKSFSVVVNNQAPITNFDLVSNESPIWSFPKVLGLNTLRYRPTSSFFYEERTKFNVSVTDPNTDNTGFIYNWKLERFAVKDINNIAGAAANTYNYTSQYPFTNSFRGQGLPWGAYRITLSVTDKPPAPPYASGDAKTVVVTKNYYIVPELAMTGSFESTNTEIMVGDTIRLKAKTSKETENVYCSFDGTNYVLSKVFEDISFAYWEKSIVVPDSITESGTYQFQFVGTTSYGGNGSVTREVRDTVSLDIVALKLINFRITDIVNHKDITFPYTKEMLISNLIKYKAGYYVTFRIDSKGKPDQVYGRVDIGNNGSIDQIINLTKVASGDTETWQGRFYTSAYLTPGTVISIKLDCKKSATTYNYNLKENWDGRSMIVDGSALQDGRINLTN